jgi:hypothetical protein
MNTEHWWKDRVRKNRRTRRKTGPSATISNIGPTWTGLRLNPVLRGKRPATNHLSRSTGASI